MKIYISDKENIDLSKNCFLTFSRKDEQAVDWNVLAQSLEQHEQEIRKPLEDEIERLKNVDKTKNKQIIEFSNKSLENYELYIKTEISRRQERLKVIEEIERWSEKFKPVDPKELLRGVSMEEYRRTVKLPTYDNLKQKLNEMKGGE